MKKLSLLRTDLLHIPMNISKKGTRLSNCIVDTICFNLIIIGHAFIFEAIGFQVPEEGSNWLGVYYFILYFAYFYFFEMFFGKTPAKFITTTIVRDAKGGQATAKQILIRTACRFIPLEPLSFLFGVTGWHDLLSNTIVVYKE